MATAEAAPQEEKYTNFAKNFQTLAQQAETETDTEAQYKFFCLVTGGLEKPSQINPNMAFEKLEPPVHAAFDISYLYLLRFKDRCSKRLLDGNIKWTDPDVAIFLLTIAHLATNIMRGPETMVGNEASNISLASKAYHSVISRINEESLTSR